MNPYLECSWDEALSQVMSVALSMEGERQELAEALCGALGELVPDSEAPAVGVDPLSIACLVAAQPSDEARCAAVCSLQEALGLYFRPVTDLSGMIEPEGGPLSGMAGETGPDLLWKLAKAARAAADAHAFGMMPNVERREFVDALKDMLTCDQAPSLTEVTCALYLLAPRTYLPLGGEVLAFVTSPDGLGIDHGDLPHTAMDYLDLLIFLTVEMDEGRLPYASFLEMARAAQERLTLAQGLAARDRQALAERLRPTLARLYPGDGEAVEDIVGMLAAGERP